jgi:hypothetical protein
MRDPQQQKKLLAVLLVAFAAFSGYRFFQMSDPDRIVSGRAAGGGAARELADLEIPQLDLEALRREAATYKPGRDPFRFGPAPPAPKPRPERRPPPPRKTPRKAQPAAAAPTPPPVARPPKPKPPPIDFVYLGSFGPEERRIAVFVKEDEIHNALAGDILLERFIVDKIGFESADIRFVGFPDEPQKRLEAGG